MSTSRQSTPPSPGTEGEETVQPVDAMAERELEILEATFELLTDEDFSSDYRDLVKRLHPDAGGTDELAARLNSLRVARKASKSGTDLAISAHDIAAIRKLHEREFRQNESDKLVREVVKHHTLRSRESKRSAQALSVASAGIAALFAFLKSLGLTTVSSGSGINEQSIIQDGTRILFFLLFLTSSAVFGAFAWLASVRANRIQNAIEDLSDALADKNTILRAVREIVSPLSTIDSWSDSELREAVDEWLQQPNWSRSPELPFPYSLLRRRKESRDIRNLVLVCGRNDFVRMLLAKGQEAGVLYEIKVETQHGPEFRYFTT